MTGADLFESSGLPRVTPEAMDVEAAFYLELRRGGPVCVNLLRARLGLPASKTLGPKVAALAREKGLRPAGVCLAEVKESKARLCRVWQARGAM